MRCSCCAEDQQLLWHPSVSQVAMYAGCTLSHALQPHQPALGTVLHHSCDAARRRRLLSRAQPRQAAASGGVMTLALRAVAWYGLKVLAALDHLQQEWGCA